MTSSRAFVLARERYLYRESSGFATAGRILVLLTELASASGEVPPVTYPQIMEHLGIRATQTVTRALDQLEAAGLIARQGNARSRRYVILWPAVETWPELSEPPAPRRHLKAV